jgi:hypothetical protein
MTQARRQACRGIFGRLAEAKEHAGEGRHGLG